MSEWVVQNRHALRNALLPVVTLAGMEVAAMLGGVVITETIFDYHGIGQFAADAASNLDFPAVLGFALYCALVLVVLNLIVDLLRSEEHKSELQPLMRISYAAFCLTKKTYDR